jgi:high affinity Mn2+ porin
MRKWSLRLAHVLEPTTPNGPTFDYRVARNRGDVIEWERRCTPKGRFGVLRLLGFANRERARTFREAVLANGTTDIESTRRDGTLQYGFGVNLEQSVTAEVGVFGRHGWSDGKTES